MLVAPFCPTLSDPMDCSPPGSSVHGILQAGMLEWVAISFSRDLPDPGMEYQVPCTAGRFFTVWATGRPYLANTRITLLPFGLGSASILHCLLAQGWKTSADSLCAASALLWERTVWPKKEKLIRNCVDCDTLSDFYRADSELCHLIISDALAFSFSSGTTRILSLII